VEIVLNVSSQVSVHALSASWRTRC